MENKIRDAFNIIKADSGLKETTKELLSQKRGRENKVLHHRRIQKTLAAVCVMLFLAVGSGSFWWMQMPVSYVSIDVNPSVELALNRFDRVVSAKAYNPEGEEILKGLSLKGKKYIEAIDAVVDSEAMKRYLTQQGEIVFTVAADGDRENEIEAGVSHCQGHIRQSTHSLGTDLETAAQAHDHGLSVGKYYAYLQLSQYDNTVTVEECRHMSMGEIHGMLKEHAQEKGGCQGTEKETQEDGCKTDDLPDHGSHHSEGHHK
ncbi:MAG: hypothetical protein HFI69_09140 [Lachnospiraceae bacterium]|nr:hypothetical protein [Lachnospiraceae bacterium]